jgi:hypothetical protein
MSELSQAWLNSGFQWQTHMYKEGRLESLNPLASHEMPGVRLHV